MKKAIITCGLVLLAIALRAENAAPAKPGANALIIEPLKPSFTWKKDADNVPLDRDPMTPTDYVWARPKTSKEPSRPKTNVVLDLKVQDIGYSATDRFAKVIGIKDFLEEGKDYSYYAGKQKVTFRIERIEPDKIIISFEGALMEFKLMSPAERIKGEGGAEDQKAEEQKAGPKKKK